jgi:hypothetical protein
VVEEMIRNSRRGIMQTIPGLCVGTACSLHASPRHECDSVPI